MVIYVYWKSDRCQDKQIKFELEFILEIQWRHYIILSSISLKAGPPFCHLNGGLGPSLAGRRNAFLLGKLLPVHTVHLCGDLKSYSYVDHLPTSEHRTGTGMRHHVMHTFVIHDLSPIGKTVKWPHGNHQADAWDARASAMSRLYLDG